MKRITVSEDEWLETKLNADRWLYIKDRHVRCNAVYMDGTSLYLVGGTLGRAKTVEAAVDACMLRYGHPIPEPVEVEGRVG